MFAGKRNTTNESGEAKVSDEGVSDILICLLTELEIMNVHLSVLTELNITKDDL